MIKLTNLRSDYVLLRKPLHTNNGTHSSDLGRPMIGDIAVGVVSAAASAAVYHVVWVWGIPMVQGYLRRVPKLDGTKWRKQKTSPDDQFITVLKVSQRGSRIVALGERTELNHSRIYRYRGEIRGGDIVLTWEDEDAPDYMFGAMVLHLSTDRQRLSGSSTYYNDRKGKVVSTDRTYELIS